MGALRDVMDMRKGIQDRRDKNKAKQKDSSSTLGSLSTPGDWAGEFKRGGKVKRTGTAKVHAGEQVLTKGQARKYRAAKR